MRALVALLLALMIAACGGRAAKDVTVLIPQGASLTKASLLLEEAGAVEDSAGFRRYAKLFGSSAPIKPGEYEIKAGMRDGDVLALLQSGRTLQRLVLVPQGMPSILVYERLLANELLTGDIPMPAEGSILPDSYAYSRGESRKAVLDRMQKAMASALAKLWKQRKPGSVVRTPEEAVILASIVEKETGKASERRMIAGVYSNRVRLGMRLQADPTIIYPITRGKPLGRRIRQSEIDAVNEYNTYAMAGLPKGPIANPGLAAIKAVLDPEPTRNLFFVADGSGGHVFAETGAGHVANVEKWREIRRQRGEI